MSVVAGPLFAAAGLLGAAGVAKLAHPASTVEALQSAQLPGTRTRRLPIRLMVDRLVVGRVIGLVEITVAAATLVLGGRITAACVAVAYLGFAAFTARLLHTAGAGASCGCFGAERSPAAPLHVVVNAGIALIAALGATWPTSGLAEVLRHQPLHGVPFVGLCALFAWMLFAVLTAVPELQAAIASTPAVGERPGFR